MGTAAIFLVFLVNPRFYAHAHPSGCFFSDTLKQFVHQIDEFLGGDSELRIIKNTIMKNINGVMNGVRQNIFHRKENLSFGKNIMKNIVKNFMPKRTSNPPDIAFKFGIPKYHRKVSRLLWPSVLSQAVFEDREYYLKLPKNKVSEHLEVQCDEKLAIHYNLDAVKVLLKRVDERKRRKTLWKDVAPALVALVSEKVLKCGFFTMYFNQRHALYAVIEENAQKWIRAIQAVVTRLLQVIAVIHYKRKIEPDNPYSWLEEWEEAFEYWLKNHNSWYIYLATFVAFSFDMLTALLFEYVSLQVISKLTRYNETIDLSKYWNYWQYFGALTSTEDGRNGFGALDDGTPWNAPIRYSSWDMPSKLIDNNFNEACKLDLGFSYASLGWESFWNRRDMKPGQQFTEYDEMKAMADTFFSCQVKSCDTDSVINIKFGVATNPANEGEGYIFVPYPKECLFSCTDIPNHFLYDNAVLTTKLGYDLICIEHQVSKEPQGPKYEVRAHCGKRIVQKFVTDYWYKTCGQCLHKCLHKECEPLRFWWLPSPLQGVTIKVIRNFTITPNMTDFPGL